MGYRSNVVAVFYTTSDPKNEQAHERNEAKLKLFMDENFPAEWKKPEWAEPDEGLTMLENDTGLLYEFKVNDVKWYEGYEAVQKFDEFWQKFVELADGVDVDEEGDEPPEWACEFIRVGENTDDIEEKSSNDTEYVLSVSRIIDRNY